MMKPSVLLFAVSLLSTVAHAQISFIDVTPGSGLNYHGKTYGSSWGDLNGDGLLDIYVSCHKNNFDDINGSYFLNDLPRIYLNQGNGYFSGSIYFVDPGEGNDLHGALIFDFDNDGDKDILIATGGVSGNLFYINDNTNNFALTNLSELYNIDFLHSRGRMASVLDLGKNGIPDVVLSNQENADDSEPTSIFTRAEGGVFDLVDTAADFFVPLASHGTLMDMNNDGVAEFVLMADDELRIYYTQTGVFENVAEIP